MHNPALLFTMQHELIIPILPYELDTTTHYTQWHIAYNLFTINNAQILRSMQFALLSMPHTIYT